MVYVLAALIGRADVFTAHDGELRFAPLPQGFALIPVTDGLADRLGGSTDRPLARDDFLWRLTSDIIEVAKEISRVGAVAYLEVEHFGGAGTTASVVWRDAVVAVGPLCLDLLEANSPSREQWPVNVALASLGVHTGTAIDQFAALDLGRHRDTEGWLSNC